MLKNLQMKVQLWLMCPEGDTEQECTVGFLTLWVSFVCYVYSSVLVWCFQIVISAKHIKWQHMMEIKVMW